ncbi:testis-expressed protein 36 [Periophthalmus magnuspinnatus]|uniref:testis-expressed protein 36 n=1 Tax=Periophthalmus magnuspinnatus TaxID=409849 RepID=UPI00145AF28C|nr:testis-expressed protein 36 [Periophthalmus magnuspinnatus]XP_055083411.1 testis-expressed protein 36 [Periophthalmus magnuspinnatus]
MVKGGRQFAPTNRGGKWFAHPNSAGSEVGSRDACTSTGIMLTQVKSTVPQALQIERYPKWKSQQKSRKYPYSDHDNKYALKDSILVYSQIGVRQVHFQDNQHKSHFYLCHEGAETKPGENMSIFKGDYVEKQVHEPNSNRRFPHNHQHKSGLAAQAQGEDYFMWFGRA